MNADQLASLRAEVRALVDDLRSQIHPVIHETVGRLVAAGELKVGLEHLCDLLGETEKVIDASSYRRLLRLANTLQLGDHYTAAVPVPPNLDRGET